MTLSSLGIGFVLVAVVVAGVASVLLIARYHLHSFLSPNVPNADASILIVEGWMDDAALKRVLPIFNHGEYSTLVTVGGPLKMGAYLSPYKTLAELSAATLTAFGCDTDRLVAVPSGDSMRDRTESTAITFREWLAVYRPDVQSVNLYSHGVHARRSWVLYKRALEPSVRVGVISSTPMAYDPVHWWRSSEGAKRVLVECIALTHTLIVGSLK
ncbi:MAG: hypothetical protein AAGA75_08535 [Cyanobacteria bacterium P01_E01_bin.6]